jgi:hypothetical protein
MRKKMSKEFLPKASTEVGKMELRESKICPVCNNDDTYYDSSDEKQNNFWCCDCETHFAQNIVNRQSPSAIQASADISEELFEALQLELCRYDQTHMGYVVENHAENIVNLFKSYGWSPTVQTSRNDLITTETLTPNHIIVLSNEDFDAFITELNNPRPPNEALKTAAKRFKKIESENK